MAKKNPFKLDVVSVRLVKDAPIASGYPIHSPQDAVVLVGSEMCQMDREVICVINLKKDGTPINCTFASIGALDQAVAQPRELIKASFLSNAAQMILMHNHPSGSLSPSKEDTMLTDRMLKVCDLVGIQMIDHVIVAGDNSQYFSFREKEILKTPKVFLQSDYHNIDFNPPIVAEKGKVR